MSETNSTPPAASAAAAALTPLPAPPDYKVGNDRSLHTNNLEYEPLIGNSQKAYLKRKGAYWKDDAGVVYKLTEDGKKIKKLEKTGNTAKWVETNLDVGTTLATIDDTKMGYCPPTTTGGARKSRRRRRHSKKQKKHRKTRKA